MKISGRSFAFLIGFLFLCCRIGGESPTCLTVYREGGAQAVFQSPKCPRWKRPGLDSRSPSDSPPYSARCQSALHQGRRKHQEDRVLCALDIRIPFPGETGIREVTVSVMAVFDGHNGDEASDMASKLLIDYFALHTYFLLDTTFSILSRNSNRWLPNKGGLSPELKWFKELDHYYVIDMGRLKFSFDGTFHMEILKEALLRAISDIDVAFSREAQRKNINSGSTATVILMADNQVLVANIGDSKAFLCSEECKSPSQAKATLVRLYRQKRTAGASPPMNFRSFRLGVPNVSVFLMAKELTRDHHPNRDDEKSRVESAGGHVTDWAGVARVNGELAVSRAIGDVYFKSFGVISIPELTDWQPLTANDNYLVAASDGVFEKLSPQNICDMLWELQTDIAERSECTSSCLYSLADYITNAAFQKGSTDNMAVVIYPFKSTVPLQSLLRGRCDREVNFEHTASDEKCTFGRTELMEMEYAHPVIANFDRLLVEGKHTHFACFYLSEDLNDDDDYTFWVQKDDQEYFHDFPHALPGGADHGCVGLDLFNDHHTCMHFGMNVNGYKEECINPEGFARFLGLLESIPFHDTGPNDHTIKDTRYILKKRYDRGAYGEVWLAFHWNCSQVNKAPESSQEDKKCSYNKVHLGDNEEKLNKSSSEDDSNSGLTGDMFILKRIMVEKGAAVYLSGLRERHFGEIFLNASASLGGPLSDGLSDSLFRESGLEACQLFKTSESLGGGSLGETFRESRGLEFSYEEGLDHIARYVESFESRSNEIWLVFRHEGVSLSKFLYTAEEVVFSADEERNEHIKRVQILRPSKWWQWLKTTEEGQEEMRNLIWQLLIALKSCHDRNITHRDIKPENMVICFEDKDGRCLKDQPSQDKNYTAKMRIIDFGSAMDDFTIKYLYGSGGPTRGEQTHEYTPPEALLNVSWYQGPARNTVKYDMWSVGVVILEIILGSPNVFHISSKTRALLDQHLDGWSESLKELAYKLRSLMEMCILISGTPSKPRRNMDVNDQSASPVPWRCSEEFFLHQIKSRDPLNIGFPNVWALRLVRELLRWDPEERLSVDDALKHPYFSQPIQRKSHPKI